MISYPAPQSGAGGGNLKKIKSKTKNFLFLLIKKWAGEIK